jgi:Tfp pilus assembly protein PilF
MNDTKVKISLLLFCATFVALALLCSSEASAQTRAIRGKVLDASGAPLQDVQIEIVGVDMKRDYKTKTDKKGEYFHGGLPFGKYRVRARKQGFQPDEVGPIAPPAGGEELVNFTLKPGEGKLASEYSKEEIERIKKQQEEAEKQAKVIGELKTTFDQGVEASRGGRYAEAIDKFKETLTKTNDPGISATIYENLGDAYAKNADALMRTGKRAEATAQLNEAINAFNEAIKRKSDQPSYYQNLANVYGKSGKFEEAKQAIESANRLNPSVAAQNYFNLGANLVNSGNTKDAVSAFEAAIKADPNYAEAYYQLGISLLGINRIDEAVTNFKKYIEIGTNEQNKQTAQEIISSLSKPKEEPKKAAPRKKKG